jgi:crotonobetainyl-CoA:carnitine CoA-transferase CaiB-like acyl-CoA transferase
MPRLPLEGIRVLDSTYVFALPYTGGYLADLGAEVIKIEGPGRPDITRTGGLYGTFPDNEAGQDWWNQPSTYNLLNRGKRSLTLDMSTESGRELFRQMVSISDVVMENFTPRVMRRWNLDYPNLKKIKPDIIMVSNTGYGHGDGPYSSYPAQATTQEGTHGHCWVTGYQGGEPAKAGRSFVDFLSTWSAVFAIGAALRYRNQTGKGQWIDIGMYQAGVMFISEYIMDAMINGREGGRIGNRHPYRAPQGCYPARGHDQWVTLSVGSDAEWQALCRLMGREELAQAPRFADVLARQRHHDEIDEIIRAWTGERDKYELMHLLQGAGIPGGPVLTGKEVHFDPHYQSRNFLERVKYPLERQIGTRIFMGRPYQFSNTPMKIRRPAPAFGEANEYVLKGLLGVDEDAYQGLAQDAIIASVPTSGEPAPRLDPAKAVEMGLMAEWDPDYRERLGLS